MRLDHLLSGWETAGHFGCLVSLIIRTTISHVACKFFEVCVFMISSIIRYVIGFTLVFGMVYWIGTKDLGLCFVIALAFINGTSAAQQEVKSLGKGMLPLFQQIDNNINHLLEKKNRFEEQISHLEEKLDAINTRIDNIKLRGM